MESDQLIDVDPAIYAENRFAVHIGKGYWPILHPGDLALFEQGVPPRPNTIVLCTVGEGCDVRVLSGSDSLLPLVSTRQAEPDNAVDIARLVCVIREGGTQQRWFNPNGIEVEDLMPVSA